MSDNPMSDHTIHDFDESLPRYEYNEVDFEMDDDFLSYKGVPFTGLVYEMKANILGLQETYLEGLPNGLYRIWYQNGQLSSQALMRRGNGNHESWSWYQDGSKKSYSKNTTIDGIDTQERWGWHQNGLQKLYLKRNFVDKDIYREWDGNGSPVKLISF